MAEDILFSIGIEGEAQYIAQVNRLVANVNAALARITIPPIPIPQIPNIPTGRGGGNGGGGGRNTPTPNLPAPNPAPFDAATASVGELQRELSRLQRQFSQGGDTSGITVVRDRLRELRVEMGAVAQTPSINTQPFNLATASVSELQRELSRLQRQFTQGGDTSTITGVRDRLRDLQVEMGAVNPTSFVERLRGAFSQSLSDATNWQDRVLEIAGGNIIANLFQKVGEGVINAGKFAINSAGQFESLRASLDVIAGSSGLGGKLFDQFQALAAKSPFNFDDVGEQGTKLLAMGIPIEDVTNRLSRIGDVAAGVGREKLPSIVYAYGQIKSQGKAMAGDLSQFINAGVPIIEVLADTLKKPTQEIKKLASAGKIGFDDIDKALLAMTDKGGKFFEMMKTQSNTFEGLWSSMEDGFQLLAANLGAKMLPLAKDIVISITNATASVIDMINNIGSIGESVGGLKNLALAAASLTLMLNGSAVATALLAARTFVLSTYTKVAAAVEAAYAGVVAYGNTIRLAATSTAVAVAVAYETQGVATAALTVLQIGLNAVMNPAVILAVVGAIGLAYAAYTAYNSATNESVIRQRQINESKTAIIEKYKDERSKIDGLFKVLNDENQLRETQKAAAKELVTSYKDLGIAYLNETSLLGQGSEAIKLRTQLQDTLRLATLTRIADTYVAEQQALIANEVLTQRLAQKAYNTGNATAGEILGVWGSVKAGIDGTLKGVLSSQETIGSATDKAINNAVNKNIKATTDKGDFLQKNIKGIVSQINNDLKEIDFSGNFNAKGLEGLDKAAAGFTSGSLKDLNEKLKTVREELDNTSPKSAVFGKLASAAAVLDDKIKSINDSLKLFGLNANSLAGLQARLGIVQDSINKADPNSKGFNDLLTKAGELDRSIKVVQDRIKQFSLVGGSAESFNFQISKLNEELNRQPSGSNLIVGLRGQIEQATQSYKLLKIELGLEPPTDSLAGLNNKLSEFNKKLNELSTSKSITEFVGLSNSIKTTQKEIDAMSAVIEASKIISGQTPLLNIVTQSDLNRIKQLEDEIKSIESLPAITVTLQLQLEGDKAALQALKEKTKNAGAVIPNLPITTQGIPSSFPQLPLVETPNIEASISAMDRLQLSVTGFGEAMGLTKMQASEFGSGLVEIFEQIGAQIKSIIIDAVTNGVFKLGEGIGGLMVGVGSFSEVMTGLLFDLGDAILVQVPKVIGLGLIQSAFTPQALATFPANLALAAAGLALIGVSGIASGVLGGLQKKRDAGKTNNTPQSLNQSLGNANLSQAAGLSGQNAEKPMLTNNISITMPIYGIDGIIISKLQQQQVVQQELK